MFENFLNIIMIHGTILWTQNIRNILENCSLNHHCCHCLKVQKSPFCTGHPELLVETFTMRPRLPSIALMLELKVIYSVSFLRPIWCLGVFFLCSSVGRNILLIRLTADNMDTIKQIYWASTNQGVTICFQFSRLFTIADYEDLHRTLLF